MPDSADLASTWHIRHVESNNSRDTFIYSSYLKLNGFEFYFLALAVHPRRPDKSVLHFDCRQIWCYLNKSTSGEWVLFAYLIINYLLIISFENILGRTNSLFPHSSGSGLVTWQQDLRDCGLSGARCRLIKFTKHNQDIYESVKAQVKKQMKLQGKWADKITAKPSQCQRRRITSGPFTDEK